jgi:hypothetical protein
MAVAPRIELEIEELVLHGFAPGDRHRIADALREELHRLLSATNRQRARESTPFRQFDAQRLAATPIGIGGHPRPESAGREIARAVYGVLASTTASHPQQEAR